MQIPYRRHYRTAIADAYDIYIEIQEVIHRQILTALGHDGPDWRAKNSCPPCAYKVGMIGP